MFRCPGADAEDDPKCSVLAQCSSDELLSATRDDGDYCRSDTVGRPLHPGQTTEADIRSSKRERQKEGAMKQAETTVARTHRTAPSPDRSRAAPQVVLAPAVPALSPLDTRCRRSSVSPRPGRGALPLSARLDLRTQAHRAVRNTAKAPSGYAARQGMRPALYRARSAGYFTPLCISPTHLLQNVVVLEEVVTRSP